MNFPWYITFDPFVITSGFSWVGDLFMKQFANSFMKSMYTLTACSCIMWAIVYGLAKSSGCKSNKSMDAVSMTFVIFWYMIGSYYMILSNEGSTIGWKYVQSLPLGYSMFWILAYTSERHIFMSQFIFWIHLSYIISYMLYYRDHPHLFAVGYMITEFTIRLPQAATDLDRALFRQPYDPPIYLNDGDDDENSQDNDSDLPDEGEVHHED